MSKILKVCNRTSNKKERKILTFCVWLSFCRLVTEAKEIFIFFFPQHMEIKHIYMSHSCAYTGSHAHRLAGLQMSVNRLSLLRSNWTTGVAHTKCLSQSFMGLEMNITHRQTSGASLEWHSTARNTQIRVEQTIRGNHYLNTPGGLCIRP